MPWVETYLQLFGKVVNVKIAICLKYASREYILFVLLIEHDFILDR